MVRLLVCLSMLVMTHPVWAKEQAKGAPQWTRISAFWNNGSLPPPHRRSGTLVIHADGRAEQQRVRGYSADPANTSHFSFQIAPEALQSLTDSLHTLKAWDTPWQELASHPVGGSMRWLRLESASGQVDIPPFPVAPQAERAAAIFSAVMALVPPQQAAPDPDD